MWGSAEKAGTAQPGEDEAQGDLIHAHCHLKAGRKDDSQALLSGARHQDKRQSAQTGAQENPSEHQERLFPGVGDGAVGQVTQRSCGLSLFGDLQKPPGRGPGHPAQGGLAVAGEDQRYPEVPAHLLWDSVIQSYDCWLLGIKITELLNSFAWEELLKI